MDRGVKAAKQTDVAAHLNGVSLPKESNQQVTTTPKRKPQGIKCLSKRRTNVALKVTY